MAANLQFAESLRQPIQRCKLDLLGRVDTGDGIQRISKFFGELEAAVSVLDTKYSHRGGRFSTVQRLVPARGMVARSLQKIHAKIIRRLSTRQRLANPWREDFQMDMPQEVFECISKDLMQRTSFGQRFRETNTQVVYEITDMRKAKYLFARMDLDGTEVDPDVILKRRMAPVQNSLERCEVLVSNEKPMELKFNKPKELFELKFHYGYWNASGVPQH